MTPLADLLAARPDLTADVADWRTRLHDRPLRLETAAAALSHDVLDVLDAVDQAQALGGAMLTLSSLRDACCRLCATASETLAVVVEAREGRRPAIAAEHLPTFIGRVDGLLAAGFLETAGPDAVPLDVYARMLRNRAQAVVHGLRYLAEGADPAYDVGQTHEHEVVELIALALVLPIALPAPSLTPA
ncbi:MAG TPA: hypothetical protein VF712_00080 [Thermoleophilaceae bacterium]